MVNQCQDRLSDINRKISKTSLVLWNVSVVGYNLTSSARDDENSKVLTYHRIIESFKFSYAWRSQLGDPEFNSRIVKVGEMLQVIQN